ncbi:MAG: glycosyltransferase [Candidatus Moraniibacteriota bacterium]
MEGFGIADIEAAAAGRPVVAARLEGLEEALSEGENGRFAESGNAESFKKVILSLLQNPEGRRTLGHQAQNYTRAHFSWEYLAQKYIEALERV